VKDWKGNSNSIYKTLGASNHTEKEREENDYYATDPIAIDKLLTVETFNHNVWECACGEGHLSDALKEHGYEVFSSDLVDRGYSNTKILDFLECGDQEFSRDIITNPPYKFAKEFAEHALDISDDGTKVALLLKLTFLEGKARRKFFDKYPPRYIYVFSERLLCAKNGDFEAMRKGGGSAVAYAWFVWYKGYTGSPEVKWL